ncbi:hypothetical protein F4803DRAFT_549378 [Xylaria telfairii]|nr:hypothetical protein F4803DRAFT_549378 [Xylaria telfairii]
MSENPHNKIIVNRALHRSLQEKLFSTKHIRRMAVQDNYAKVQKRRVQDALVQIEAFKRCRNIFWEMGGTAARPCSFVPRHEFYFINDLVGLLVYHFEHQFIFKSLGDLEARRTTLSARLFLISLFEALKQVRDRVVAIDEMHEKAYRKELRRSRGARKRRIKSAKQRATHSLQVGVTTPLRPSPLRQVTGVDDGDTWDAQKANAEFSWEDYINWDGDVEMQG